MQSTGIRVVVSRVFAGIAILVALPTYFALGARLWWVCDLATHFSAFYAAALLPTAIILLIFKRWRLFAYVAVALAINGALLAPFYFPASTPSDSQPLRIVSINVLYRNSQHQRLLDFIHHAAPAIVLLLEVDSSWQPALNTLEAEFPHSLVDAKAGSFGIAIFSKLPLEYPQLVDIGSMGIASIEAIVRVDGVPVQLVGTHFIAPMSSERSRLRNEQLLATARELARMQRPCLLLGDLNITPFSPYFRDLLAIGNLRNSQLGFGIQPSWLQAIPIDHLLHSSDITIADRQIGPDVGSDHRPLIVDIAVKKRPK